MDLLFFGRETCSGRPTIPHPQIYSRQFVLVPLNDIAPDWVCPKTNKSVRDLLAELLSKEEKIPFRVVNGEEP